MTKEEMIAKSKRSVHITKRHTLKEECKLGFEYEAQLLCCDKTIPTNETVIKECPFCGTKLETIFDPLERVSAVIIVDRIGNDTYYDIRLFKTPELAKEWRKNTTAKETILRDDVPVIDERC